jgi:small conductance mechanosensitive channel
MIFRGLGHLRPRALLAALLVALVAGLCLAGPGPGLAAEHQAAEATPPAAELEAVVETLEDEAARGRLIAELKALIAAERRLEAAEAPPAASNVVLRVLSERLDLLGRTVSQLAFDSGDLARVGTWFTDQARVPERRGLWLRILWQVVLSVVVGLVAGRLVTLALRRPRRGLEQREAPRLWLRVPLLAARTVLDVAPIAAFAAAAYAVLAIVQPDDRTRLVLLAAINAIVIARSGLALAKLAFTPLAPSLRLVALDDVTAAYVFVWARRLVNIPVYGYFVAQAGLVLGLPQAGYDVFIKLLGLLVAAMVLVLVLQNRGPVAAAIRVADDKRAESNPAVRALRDRLGDVWHVLAGLYILMIFGVWALQISDGFVYLLRGTAVTVAAVVVARLLVFVVRQGVSRAFRVSAEIRTRYPALEERADRYVAIVRYALEAVVWLVALVVALEAWRLDVLSLLGGATGRALAAGALDIVVVLAAAALAWEFANAAISRFLEATDEAGELIQRGARTRTLLPLARKALLVAIVTVSGLSVLSTLGIEIAPLLAGAGVVGLAIGFGAQTLVKDIITGAFILFEDILAVGDVATVGGHTGVVEDISVRTIRLRDYSGTVHLIPFSSVDTVTNLTKDFSYAVLNVGIAYRENVDEVFAVLNEIVEEMRADPDYAPDILEPLEIAGLNELADSAVVIRARIKTKPIRQWAVGREFNRRMKARFDELGIEIPFPHQTVYFGVDKEGQAPPARVELSEAAAEAAAAPEPAPPRPARRAAQPSRAAGGPEEDGE